MANPCLVGDNHDGDISFGSCAAEVENSIEKLEILDAMNIVLLDIDRPVQVEKECRS